MNKTAKTIATALIAVATLSTAHASAPNASPNLSKPIAWWDGADKTDPLLKCPKVMPSTVVETVACPSSHVGSQDLIIRSHLVVENGMCTVGTTVELVGNCFPRQSSSPITAISRCFGDAVPFAGQKGVKLVHLDTRGAIWSTSEGMVSIACWNATEAK